MIETDGRWKVNGETAGGSGWRRVYVGGGGVCVCWGGSSAFVLRNCRRTRSGSVTKAVLDCGGLQTGILFGPASTAGDRLSWYQYLQALWDASEKVEMMPGAVEMCGKVNNKEERDGGYIW